MMLLSPRRPGSPWSRLNKQRVEKLLAAGLMMSPGQATLDRAKADGSWTLLDDVEDLIVPDDLADALAANEAVASHFDAFSGASKKAILWWPKIAKTEPTRAKRVAETARMAEHGLRANHPEAREFSRKQRQDR